MEQNACEVGFSKRLGGGRTWIVRLGAAAPCRGGGGPTADGVSTGDDADVLLTRYLEGIGMPARVVRPLDGVPLRCNDLRAASRAARERNEVLLVDNSLVGSCGCAATRLGADLVVERLGDTLGNVLPDAGDCYAVTASKWFLKGRIPWRGELPVGERLGQDEAGLVAAAIPAYDARRRAANDCAQVMACYLACHPRVDGVWYPGLAGDDSYEAGAANLLDGFGPLVDFRVADVGDGGPASACLPGGSFLATLGGGMARLRCGDADARELVMALEALLA